MSGEQPFKTFTTAKTWGAWLARCHGTSDGVWLRFYKKAAGRPTMSYDEALEAALCWGWIDGQSKGLDEVSWIQRYTPRRARSLWSKRNRDRVAKLIREKRMKPAGLRQVEAAKADGRWEAAYDSPSNMTVPADFLRALRKDREAYRFFKTLNRSNTYAIVWRLQTAKRPETRERRMRALLAMMARGERIY